MRSTEPSTDRAAPRTREGDEGEGRGEEEVSPSRKSVGKRIDGKRSGDGEAGG